MRLLYIHQYFTFPQQPGGTRSYDLSRKFIENGIDVTVITTASKIKDLDNTKKNRWIFLEREDIKLWVLNCSYNQKMSIPRRMMSFVKFMWFSSIKAIKINTDLLLATSTPLTVAVPALIKKLFHRTPYIFEARDIWPEGPIKLGYIKNGLSIKVLYWVEKLIYKHATFVVVLSSGMKDNIETRLKNKAPQMTVIPNISEIQRFADTSNKYELGINLDNKKVILYAGTMGPVNKIIYVAELAKLLDNIGCNDIVFLIVGEGNQKAAIIKYCQENDILNKNIYFAGNVPKNTLPYLYSMVTMGSSFVLDNEIKWHNSANKFFDTLAAGKPILINHKGWQAELIESKNCGYVLPACITHKDVSKFVDYIHNEELLTEHGQNAKKVAVEQFSLEVATKNYMKVINNITNSFGKGK